MTKYLLMFCGIASTILLHGCAALTGESVFANKQYQNRPSFPNKLAIVPLTRLGPPLACSGKCPPLEQATDQVFEESFGKFSDKVSLTPMAKNRSFFNANPDLLTKLLDIKYSEQELRDNPSLETALNSAGLASLREQLENADLLLVPAKLEFAPNLGMVFGYSEFRLYDLHAGTLIYSSSAKMNVNRADEAGRGVMAFVLIGRAKGDFEKFYLNK